MPISIGTPVCFAGRGTGCPITLSGAAQAALGALAKLRGNFAFVLYDAGARVLGF